MIDFITTTKMTDRSVVSACLLGSRLNGTGLPGVVLSGGERPTKAPEGTAVVKARAAAYAFAAAANGADGSQKTQHHSMWAFRGLEPWRDPA